MLEHKNGGFARPRKGEYESLTFRQFRQHVRIYQSLAMLADGGSIQDVAFAIGYESAPAFIAAFRKIMGQSPGRYRRKQAP
ncbi:AraC family transcriptional regulator [Sphingomonas populi]|uniref:AraC family transcriptional regulator n=1 Tax=Sphingomonas populi TaxID=2484750 RepID=A0A4Q6Y3F3_9SPHN|nr:AraC family transcriptional regulator [Sphingomonas populi]